MDHFIGFDQLLRLALVRERELAITGPEGFIERVRGRIDGYTWNVIHDYPVRLRVEEIAAGRVRSVAFTGAGGMRPEPLGEREFDGVIDTRRAYRIRGAVLDHGVSVLGVVLEEVERLAVDRGRLEALGLRPGEWLRRLKEVVRAAEPDLTPIEAEEIGGGTRTYSAGELTREILRRTPGQRLAYLTDVRGTEANLARAAELAGGVDLLICETGFLHADRALATERGHLTARQAGELARAAGARRLAPVHFSARYGGRERELLDEAATSFGGPIVQLPTGISGTSP